MRILANYGYKANGDTYSVTFETIGDVPREHADATVDELFRMAKAAIQRQLNPEADPLEFPPKEEVVVPQPKKNGNGNSKPEGNGLASDKPEGNGLASFGQSHSQSHKPQLKDPDAPATKKQKSLIIRLAKERGQFIENLNSLTMQEASQTIDELMSVAV